MQALCRVFLSVPPSLTLLSVNPGYQAATPAVHTSGPACYRPQDQFYPQAREPTHFSLPPVPKDLAPKMLYCLPSTLHLTEGKGTGWQAGAQRHRCPFKVALWSFIVCSSVPF